MELRIRYRDLRVTDPEYKKKILDVIDSVLSHGQILLGPEVEKFETEVARLIGTKYCIGLGSGTDAAYVALRSLGIGPGDEVITTPLSWIATFNAIYFTGARPVVVDIAEDLNIDVDLIEQAITPNTRAIFPVHFTGRMCDMTRICEIARKYNLFVIEDAAQAFGARHAGRLAGSFGHTGAFSMNPMKVLPAFGEVGAVVTNNENAYKFASSMRYLGTVRRDTCISPSLNFKIDTIHAATLLVNLTYLEKRIERRVKIAKHYTRELGSIIDCPNVDLGADERCVFFDYTVKVRERAKLIEFLTEKGIETRIKHPILMSDQPAYAYLKYPQIPRARRIVSEILSLPAHEVLSDDDVDYVVRAVKEFYRRN